MKSVVVKLHRHIRENNVDEIGKMYESTVISLPWEDVAEYVDNDDYIFCLLYREMWYRQLSSPTLKHRIGSWCNYCNLFQAWNVYDVVNLLEGLMENSKILEQAKDGGLQLLTAAEEGSGSALKVMGYFSMVGLLRVHCLLGSYEIRLNCLRPIDISQQGFYTSLIATHITTIFHYGFANLMLGRYVDAICEVNNIFVYIFKQPQPESPQILNKIEQIVCSASNLPPTKSS
ncbi:uncharacterized protein LOC143549274 [Bidens hawaiensis]|uniref:uncharacterized protein LOC143549274 n=1 Tax=Bidens hawaiensis TaxID=980011 RepID=UPI00404B3EC2